MIGGIPIELFAVAALAYLVGGVVKGAVGFALPMIAVTSTAALLDPETAVALVIIPVMAANFAQAVWLGRSAALESLWRRRTLIVTTVVVIMLSAPLLPAMDDRIFYALLGVATAIFASLQLAGWRPVVPNGHEGLAGVGAGVVAGFFGGLSGVWGPPTVLYLQALQLSKDEQVRSLGVSFLCGAIVLAPSHAASGVLTSEIAVASLAMLVPTQIGMMIGTRLRSRLDAERFRRWTLIVLTLAALNLLRRAAFG